MTTEAEREAFEIWAKSEHLNGVSKWTSEKLWKAWQARAALDQRQGWAVTDEMVEAACRVLQPHWWYFFEKEKGPYRDDVRKALQTATLQSIAKPVKVPNEITVVTIDNEVIAYARGWNDCREAILAATPDYTDTKENDT